jgi:hypothetical protein
VGEVRGLDSGTGSNGGWDCERCILRMRRLRVCGPYSRRRPHNLQKTFQPLSYRRRGSIRNLSVGGHMLGSGRTFDDRANKSTTVVVVLLQERFHFSKCLYVQSKNRRSGSHFSIRKIVY